MVAGKSLCDSMLSLVDTIAADVRNTDAARLDAMRAALAPLGAIADRYDANGLDEARPDWGDNSIDPKQIEIFQGRGGKQLLTLADCFAARAALAK